MLGIRRFYPVQTSFGIAKLALITTVIDLFLTVPWAIGDMIGSLGIPKLKFVHRDWRRH